MGHGKKLKLMRTYDITDFLMAEIVVSNQTPVKASRGSTTQPSAAVGYDPASSAPSSGERQVKESGGGNDAASAEPELCMFVLAGKNESFVLGAPNSAEATAWIENINSVVKRATRNSVALKKRGVSDANKATGLFFVVNYFYHRI